jgi:hypothetical protein
MRRVRKAVITLISTGLLFLGGSAAFAASGALSQASLCIPPLGTITIPGLTCTMTTTPPTTTKPTPSSTAPSTSAPSTSATTGAPTSAAATTLPAVVKQATTPSATELAGTSGRSGLPTTGALADPAAAVPLLAVPQAQDAPSAPQLASNASPAPNTQVLAAGPVGGNVLAAGQTSLLTPSTHPLLRVLLGLVAIAIAALAAAQVPAARRLMLHTSDQ